MRIIAVVNQKGGVGKTTTSVNLGAALARRGRRVLLVDMDPQGNLTDHLLGDPAPGTERTSIYDLLVEGAGLAECVVPTSTPGLSVVPSHEDLAGAELDLASVIGREVILRDALAEVPEDAWDYVFLDCPPSLGLLSLNALAAAHEVFIALQTEFFAMRGLGALDRTIDLVRRRINPRLVVGGIVPTLVDATRLSREVVDEVRTHYGDLVFATRIRTNIRLAEAPSYGQHIFDYAPDSPGAQDYAALARELEEGRPAAAVPPAAATDAAPQAAMVPARPATGRPRGIARAIAEAMAALGVAPTAPEGGATPPPVPTAGAVPPREPAAVVPSPAPIAGAPPVGPTASAASGEEGEAGSPPPPLAPPPPPGPGTVAPPAAQGPVAPVPPPAPAAPAPPPAPPPAPRRAAVPLPVLRSGPRPLSIAPMPTRPPGSLPRPRVTASQGPAS